MFKTLYCVMIFPFKTSERNMFLYLKNTSLWTLNKIEFYIFAYKVNIALEKPTDQLHQYNENDDRFEASNAVDGRKSNLSAWAGECTISADGYEIATWWVNLGSIHRIHHITIYYRTDNAAWGMSFDLDIFVLHLSKPIVFIDIKIKH